MAAFLGGTLQHLDVTPDLLLVLETGEKLSSQPRDQICDPIEELSERLAHLSVKSKKDVQVVAESLAKMNRACYYILHVIEPLLNLRFRLEQEVSQSDIDRCEEKFSSNSHLYNECDTIKDKNV
jgi:hypothetical protein